MNLSDAFKIPLRVPNLGKPGACRNKVISNQENPRVLLAALNNGAYLNHTYNERVLSNSAAWVGIR